MSQSISRRSFLKCAGSGAVSLAAALLTGVPAAAQQPRLAGEPALLDGKAAAADRLAVAPGSKAHAQGIELVGGGDLPAEQVAGSYGQRF